jgi:hypothetical protein
MPDAPTAIQGAWSASAETPGSIQGAFTVSAATPGSIAGAFTVSAATPGSIAGAFTVSAARPGHVAYIPTILKSAQVLVEFSGNTHQFLITASTPGSLGNNLTFRINAVSAGYVTGITVTDNNDIVVSPKTKAMMLIGGGTPCELRVLYNNDGNGIPGYGLWYESEEGTQTLLFALSGKWYLQHFDDGELLYAAEKTSSNTTPEGLTGWTVITGPNIQPTITAAATSVRQVVDLVNNTPAARALITASETGYAFGEVSYFGQNSLLGGTDWPGTETPGAIQGAFSASASTPGSIQGAFTVSAATPGAIQGAFTASASTPGAIQGAWSTSPAVPGAIA